MRLLVIILDCLVLVTFVGLFVITSKSSFTVEDLAPLLFVVVFIIVNLIALVSSNTKTEPKESKNNN